MPLLIAGSPVPLQCFLSGDNLQGLFFSTSQLTAFYKIALKKKNLT